MHLCPRGSYYPRPRYGQLSGEPNTGSMGRLALILSHDALDILSASLSALKLFTWFAPLLALDTQILITIIT